MIRVVVAGGWEDCDSFYFISFRLGGGREVQKIGDICMLLLPLSRFSHVWLCATHRRQPTRIPCPWDSPGKNTGVGCHFLLQCMKEKSESEVAQSCPTLCAPMGCSLPGSSVHGIFQVRVLKWVAIAFSEGIYVYLWLIHVDIWQKPTQ